MSLPTSRIAAQLAGERYYYGKDCTQHHGGKRYAANGKCPTCQAARNGNAHYGQRGSAITARLTAKAEGKPTYKGTSCKRGHSGHRYTSSGNCVECYALALRHRDPLVERRVNAAWFANNREYRRLYNRAQRELKRDLEMKRLQSESREREALKLKAAELQRRRERNAEKRAQSCRA